jgi:hypothetical protein
MLDPINFNYSTVVATLCDQLVLALQSAAPWFEALPVTPRGYRAYSGMSLDLHIQHGYVEVSLRTSGERANERYIGDWSHSGFLSSLNGPCDNEMGQIAATIMKKYSEVGEDDLRGQADRRHLLFLAGAEALLQREISEILNGYRIEAPYFGSELGGYPFSYFVLDPDEGLSANYCDLVRSKLITARLLGIDGV